MFVSHCLKRTSNNIVQNNYIIDNNIDSLGKLYNNNIQLLEEETESVETSKMSEQRIDFYILKSLAVS